MKKKRPDLLKTVARFWVWRPERHCIKRKLSDSCAHLRLRFCPAQRLPRVCPLLAFRHQLKVKTFLLRVMLPIALAAALLVYFVLLEHRVRTLESRIYQPCE